MRVCTRRTKSPTEYPKDILEGSISIGFREKIDEKREGGIDADEGWLAQPRQAARAIPPSSLLVAFE